MPTEAADRYLSRIGEDAAALLGSGVVVVGVESEDLGGSVRLLVRYELSGTVRETAARGETVVAAHSALRMQLARDRLGFAFEGLVDRPQPAAVRLQ